VTDVVQPWRCLRSGGERRAAHQSAASQFCPPWRILHRQTPGRGSIAT